MRVIDFGRALRHQSGDHQRRARAQVGGLDGRAVQLGHALDHSGLLVDAHPRAHALHLRQVAEAGFENVFHHGRCARRGAEQRAHGLLQIGREAGVDLRFERHRAVVADRTDANRVVPLLHARAHLQQLGGQRFHVRGDAAADRHVAVRRGGSDHQRARLDLIRNDGIRAAALQPLHTADANHIRARALDAAAHRVEEVRHIDDVRLLGGVVDCRRAARAGGRQHDVDRAADGDHIHEHIRADQPVRLRHDEAARRLHLRAERAHALDVLVNRPAPDVASARQRHLRPAKARQQRADIIRRRAHPAAELQRHIRAVDGAGIDLHHARVGIPVDLRAQMAQRLHRNVDVLDVRQIFDHAGRFAEDRGGNHRDRSILAAADAHGSLQPLPTRDEHSFFCHDDPPYDCRSPGVVSLTPILYTDWRTLASKAKNGAAPYSDAKISL